MKKTADTDSNAKGTSPWGRFPQKISKLKVSEMLFFMHFLRHISKTNLEKVKTLKILSINQSINQGLQRLFSIFIPQR